NNDELAARIRLMKNFGFAGYDNVVYIGTNGKMSEISAAMGLTSFDCLADFISANRNNYVAYAEQLKDIPGVRLYPVNGEEERNYQYVVLEIDESVSGIRRDALLQVLHAENIMARRYFYPGCHRMEPYRSYFPHAGLLLPETEKLVQRVMVLPTGTTVSEGEIQVICSVIKRAINNSCEVMARLAPDTLNPVS
ncbi:MAG: DegT/DnrJ/EryC1/StrS family aminotransferase, partial [Geobacteraceae bacterium]|nr:DegT/DnrJ/EryC1/StrS family aminotransferase [Geobacteraceae bacterium]